MLDPNDDSLFTEVLAGELSQGASFVDTSEFLAEAERRHIHDRNSVYGPANAITVFVPIDYKDGSAGDAFEEMWNRHVVKGINKVNGESVQHFTTNADLVFALCPIASSSLAALSTAQCSFGGVPMRTLNYNSNGCIYHSIETSLPDLRPFPGEMYRLHTCYLAGEVIDFTFRGCGLKPALENALTLVVSTTQEDRTPIAANQKMAWHGHGTSVSIVIPPVKMRTSVMLWLSLYDNQLKQPIISTTLPWFLVIQPNTNMLTNPVVHDIIPKIGHVNGELWIRGTGFDDKNLRVTVGKSAAQIFHCEPTLIRCFIPPGTGKQTVWVANGNVYTRYDSGFVYETASASSNAKAAPS